MEANPKRVHYYHADVNALGGRISSPFEQVVPTQAPLSLAASGGYASTNTEAFELKGILSFKKANSQVAGSVSQKSGGWTTLATVAMEGLNVLDIVTADRVVVQIATEHPREGYEPKVSFTGTRFENLRVAGHKIDVELDLELCSPGGGEKYPVRPCIQDEHFLAAVAEQRRRMIDERTIPAWQKDKQVPNWVRELYAWDNSAAQREAQGFVLCTLVKEVKGEFPGKVFGNVLEIPDFGKVFLAELTVDRNTFRLIGIRLELGCPVESQTSFTTAAVEGRTHP